MAFCLRDKMEQAFVAHGCRLAPVASHKPDAHRSLFTPAAMTSMETFDLVRRMRNPELGVLRHKDGMVRLKRGKTYVCRWEPPLPC